MWQFAGLYLGRDDKNARRISRQKDVSSGRKFQKRYSQSTKNRMALYFEIILSIPPSNAFSKKRHRAQYSRVFQSYSQGKGG